MRGGEHRQVTLDLAPDVAQGDAEHSLVTVERVHLYALGVAAWGEAVLGDGGTIITQDFDRYPVVRMQSVPVDAHGKVS